MSENKKAKKTLVIGLGGTGCAVVSGVKRMVREMQAYPDPDIQFIGFDTDKNQEDAPDLDIVLTSTKAKVGEILQNKYHQNWQEWFPDNDSLMDEDMLDGAGQKRVLSRLAFSDVIRRKTPLKVLDDAIKKLTLENGNPQDVALKVMVVSSFAGGTGAGMFMQLPLYLRKKYGEQDMSFSKITIRGLFALPDVFLSSARYDEVQRESMYANAYASLKELAAINMICLSQNPDIRKYTMQIDSLFDSRKMFKRLDERGDDRTVTAVGKKPYDFIFFVDNQNRNQRILGQKEDYLDLMTRLTYMQVYSPLENRLDSREDNLIETRMESDGEAMYGSAGAARLVYPYEDIAQYCALRATQDVLNGKWTKFDRDYERQLAVAKENRKKDTTMKLPLRSAAYITSVKNELKDRSASFAFMRSAVYDLVAPADNNSIDGQPSYLIEQERVPQYVGKVINYISSLIQDDPQLKKELKKCGDFKKILQKTKWSKDDAKANVTVAEMCLEKLLEKIEERTNAMLLYAVDSIIPDDLSLVDRSALNDYQIFSILEKKNENGETSAVHPLAARYLLYCIRDMVAEQLNGGKDGAIGARKMMERCIADTNTYNNKDYKPSTSDRDKAADVIGEKGFGYLDVQKKFYRAYRNQLSNLEKYMLSRFQTLVYTELLEKLNAMILYFERVFDSIVSVEADINNEIENLKNKYRNEASDAVYVCASEEHMEKIYQSTTADVEDEESSSIYDELLLAVYEGAMDLLEYEETKRREGWDRKKIKEFDAISGAKNAHMVSDIFEKKIIPYYKETLCAKNADQLDLNICKALRLHIMEQLKREREAAGNFNPILQSDIDKRRSEILASVETKAAPYLMSVDYHTPNKNLGADTGEANTLDSVYWGLHVDVEKEICNEIGKKKVDTYFGTTASFSSDVRAHKAYSRYAYDCYRGLYSVRLTEIPKFREEPDNMGVFFENYQSRLDKMNAGRYDQPDLACTPHLDIRWHSRQYLPMIGHDKDSLDDQKAARAMWLSFLYGTLFCKVDRKTGAKNMWIRYWRLRPGKPVEKYYREQKELFCNGKNVAANQVFEVFRAFQQDTRSTGMMLETLEALLTEDCTATDYNTDFTGKNANPLARALICVKEEATAEEADTEEMADVSNAVSRGNVLDLLNAVIKNKQADESEKQIVVDALIKILEEYAQTMSDARYQELLMHILSNSVFANARNRSMDAKNLVLDEHFAVAIAAHDAKSKKTAKAK